MGSPASRVGDFHACPMVDPGPKPHVGGVVAPPGEATVLIGGAPAARVGDAAICIGPSDQIALGAPLTRVGGKHAARIGDPTVHGGAIVVGFPTVLIGLQPRGRAACAFQSSARRSATSAEQQEIQDALDAGDNQRAIDLTKQYYEIDVTNAPNGVVFDPLETNYGVTKINGDVKLGSLAMSSPDVLASTIVHEVTHSNQAQIQRTVTPSISDWPPDAASINLDEALAYDAELQSARTTGLSDAEIDVAAKRNGKHYGDLDARGRAAVDSCAYPG